MATIDEILKAKGQKKPELQTPDPGALPTAPVMPALPEVKQETAPASELESALSEYRRAGQEASARQNAREATALWSGGSMRDINTDDLKAMREAPLEAYKRRVEARAAANKAILDSITGRRSLAETNKIQMEPQMKQYEAGLDEHKQALLRRSVEAEGAATRQSEEARAQASQDTQRELETMRQKGETERFKPYEVKINPITGEQQVVNMHTGETQGGNQFDESMRPVYEQYQAKRAGLDKPLNEAQEGQEELGHAREAVKANPESFDNRLATGAENIAGRIPLVGGMISQQIGPYLRGEKGQAARQQALQAAASRIHDIAGTRGFSASEQGTMAKLTPSGNDTAEQVQSKLQQAEEVYARKEARIKAKLPVTIQHPKGGGSAAPPQVINGKKYHMVNGQLMVEE